MDYMGRNHYRLLDNLLEEVLEDAASLCKHEYGNFVIRHCLEFGFLEQQQWIVQALCTDLTGNARHENGSRVVESVLQFCGPQALQTVGEGLLGDEEEFVSLAKDLYGRHVVKALLKTQWDGQQRAVNVLRLARRELQAAKYGNLVIAALRDMP